MQNSCFFFQFYAPVVNLIELHNVSAIFHLMANFSGPTCTHVICHRMTEFYTVVHAEKGQVLEIHCHTHHTGAVAGFLSCCQRYVLPGCIFTGSFV